MKAAATIAVVDYRNPYDPLGTDRGKREKKKKQWREGEREKEMLLDPLEVRCSCIWVSFSCPATGVLRRQAHGAKVGVVLRQWLFGHLGLPLPFPCPLFFAMFEFHDEPTPTGLVCFLRAPLDKPVASNCFALRGAGLMMCFWGLVCEGKI